MTVGDLAQLSLFMYYTYVYGCVLACALAQYVHGATGNLGELALPSHHIVARDGIQVTGVGTQCFYPLSHLASPAITQFESRCQHDCPVKSVKCHYPEQSGSPTIP